MRSLIFSFCMGDMANASGTVSSLDQQLDKSEPKVLDNQVRVSTPENISFQYEVTGPSRRLFAYVADVVLTLSVYFLLAFLLTIVFGFAASRLINTPLAPLIELVGGIASGLLYAFAFISMWFYGTYMETNYNGQTFGKMMLNVRAISVDGSAIDATQATLRNFFRLMDVSPFVSIALIFGPEFGEFPIFNMPLIPIFAFGLLAMMISPRYQRIGDFVAGTIVVTEDSKWSHGLAKFQDPRVPDLAELIPEGFIVTPSLAKSLAEYVDRRRVLPQQRIFEIASHLGQPLLEKFGLPKDTNPDLLLCSLYFKTFINERDEVKLNPFAPVEKSIDPKPSVAAVVAHVAGTSETTPTLEELENLPESESASSPLDDLDPEVKS